MKVKSYIKSCNLKQLAQLLASSWWSDQNLQLVFDEKTIEEQGKKMYTHVFQTEIPEIIRYGQNSWIDTKTRKIKII
jgi:hypothetical protein